MVGAGEGRREWGCASTHLFSEHVSRSEISFELQSVVHALVFAVQHLDRGGRREQPHTPLQDDVEDGTTGADVVDALGGFDAEHAEVFAEIVEL